MGRIPRGESTKMIYAVITDEKDKCIKCGRKIHKDKYVTQTKKGFICFKCKKVEKNVKEGEDGS